MSEENRIGEGSKSDSDISLGNAKMDGAASTGGSEDTLPAMFIIIMVSIVIIIVLVFVFALVFAMAVGTGTASAIAFGLFSVSIPERQLSS